MPRFPGAAGRAAPLLLGGIATLLLVHWGALSAWAYRTTGLFSWLGFDFGYFWAVTRAGLTGGPAAGYDVAAIAGASQALLPYLAAGGGRPLVVPAALAAGLLPAARPLRPPPAAGGVPAVDAAQPGRRPPGDRAPGRPRRPRPAAWPSPSPCSPWRSTPSPTRSSSASPASWACWPSTGARRAFAQGPRSSGPGCGRACCWSSPSTPRSWCWCCCGSAAGGPSPAWRPPACSSSARRSSCSGRDGFPAYAGAVLDLARFRVAEPLIAPGLMISWRGVLLNLLPVTAPDGLGVALALLASAATALALWPVWRGPWAADGPRFDRQLLATMLVTMLASFHNHAHGATLLVAPALAVLAGRAAGPVLGALLFLAVLLPNAVFFATLNGVWVAGSLVGLMAAALAVLLIRERRPVAPYAGDAPGAKRGPGGTGRRRRRWAPAPRARRAVRTRRRRRPRPRPRRR